MNRIHGIPGRILPPQNGEGNKKQMPNNIAVSCHENTQEPPWLDNVTEFAEQVLGKLSLDRWELSILFCSDPCIAELNKQYRGIDGPTDVLSFEQGDEYVDQEGITWFTAGDLVISLDSLANNAGHFAVPVDDELKRLLIHGILHLDGFDHATNDAGEEMLIFQERLMDSFSSVKIMRE